MILVVCPNPSIDTYAVLDSLRLGEPNRFSEAKEFPGGKGLHVAFALQEAGATTELLGFWAGANGKWVRSQCENLGIHVSGVELSGNTRKCYTIKSMDSRLDHTEFLEPGPSMNSLAFESFLQQFEEKVAMAETVVISGSWPFNSPEDSAKRLIKICNQYSKPVILDCTGVQLKNAVEADIAILHLNESEYLTASQEMELSFEKVGVLALTKGKEGLRLIQSNQCLHANVKVDRVISTVGSGDCLTAGIALAFTECKSLEEMARYGVAFGAANCMRADLGMLYKNDIENLLPQVSIKELAYES